MKSKISKSKMFIKIKQKFSLFVVLHLIDCSQWLLNRGFGRCAKAVLTIAGKVDFQ